MWRVFNRCIRVLVQYPFHSVTLWKSASFAEIHSIRKRSSVLHSCRRHRSIQKMVQQVLDKSYTTGMGKTRLSSWLSSWPSRVCWKLCKQSGCELILTPCITRPEPVLRCLCSILTRSKSRGESRRLRQKRRRNGAVAQVSFLRVSGLRTVGSSSISHSRRAQPPCLAL